MEPHSERGIFTCILRKVSYPRSGAYSGGSSHYSGKIAEITGIPEDQFTPLISQWKPPSGEIELLLFALQAAVVGIIFGLVFGYWLGGKASERRKTE